MKYIFVKQRDSTDCAAAWKDFTEKLPTFYGFCSMPAICKVAFLLCAGVIKRKFQNKNW